MRTRTRFRATSVGPGTLAKSGDEDFILIVGYNFPIPLEVFKLSDIFSIALNIDDACT